MSVPTRASNVTIDSAYTNPLNLDYIITSINSKSLTMFFQSATPTAKNISITNAVSTIIVNTLIDSNTSTVINISSLPGESIIVKSLAGTVLYSFTYTLSSPVPVQASNVTIDSAYTNSPNLNSYIITSIDWKSLTIFQSAAYSPTINITNAVTNISINTVVDSYTPTVINISSLAGDSIIVKLSNGTVLYSFTYTYASPLSSIVDSFGYVGSLTDNSWTAYSTQTPKISAGGTSLVYPGLPASTGANRVLISNVGEDVLKLFPSIRTTGIAVKAYYSAMIKPSVALSGADYFISFINTFIPTTTTSITTTTQLGRLYIKQGSLSTSRYKVGVSLGVSPITYSTNEFDLNVTAFAVLRISNTATNQVQVSVFMNPIPGSSSEPTTATVSTVAATALVGTLYGILLRQNNITFSPILELDDLRVGTTWESVTPSSSQITVTVPDAPTIGTAVLGSNSGEVNVYFTAPTNTGGANITEYTVTPSIGTAKSAYASPFLFTGLTPGTGYTFTVKAKNSAGSSAASDSSNEVTPTYATVPDAPTIGTAVLNSVSGQVKVYFTAPTNTGGAPITGYTVTSSSGGITGTNTSSPVIVAGLSNAPYTFTVVANNSAGSSAASDSSNEVTPLTVPDAPTGVAASRNNNGEIFVEFTAPTNTGGSAITNYTVTSSNGIGRTATESPFLFPALPVGTLVTFTVKANNILGSSAASGISNQVTTPAYPNAPTGVTATAYDGRVSVAFTPPANNGGADITGYSVLYNSVNPTEVFGSSSPIEITGLTNGTQYAFSVFAINSVGTSSASAVSGIATPISPLLSNFLTFNISNFVITLPSVTNGQNIDTESIVIPATLTDGEKKLATKRIIKSIFENKVDLERFKVKSSSLFITAPNVKEDLIIVKSVTSTDSPAFVLDNLVDPNTSLYSALENVGEINKFKLKGQEFSIIKTTTGFNFIDSNSISTSYLSGEQREYNGLNIAFASAVVTQSQIPAPTITSVVPGNGQVTVNFTAPDTGSSVITGYTVSVYDNSTPSVFIKDVTGVSTVTSIVVPGLVNGTTYKFNVAANISGGGSSAASAASDPVTPVTVPDAPTITSITPTTNSATVNFSAPTNTGGSAILSYTVSSAGLTDIIVSASASPLQALFTGLSEDTDYEFTVIAVNGVGPSVSSIPMGGHTTTTQASITKPSVPLIYSVENAGSNFKLTFTTPMTDGGAPIESYTLTTTKGAETSITTSNVVVTPINYGGFILIPFTTSSTEITYTFELQAYNGTELSDKSTIHITVDGTPLLPAVTISADKTTINSGESVTFTSVLSNAGEITPTYQWYIEGSPVGLGSMTYTTTSLVNEDSVYVVLSVEGGGASITSNTLTITVTAPLVPSVSIAADKTTINSGESVTFTATPINGGLTPTYQWYIGGTLVAGQNSATFTTSSLANNDSVFANLTTSDGVVLATAYSIVMTVNSGEQSTGSAGSSGSVNTPVVVNFAVDVDANGAIQILGAAALELTNVIDAAVKLPVSALYTATNSMFEFWEPLDDPATGGVNERGLIYAELAETAPRNYKLLTHSLENGVYDCLTGEIDGSLAAPFNLPAYASNIEYRKASSFGELALKTVAHYIMGHVAGTSSITNDKAFIDGMNSSTFSKYVGTALTASDDYTASISPSASDAMLAKALVKAIATKSDDDVALIARQVIGQDASRAMDQDNNKLLPLVHHALKFIAGDIIYVNIKLQQPTITIGAGQLVTKSTLNAKFPAVSDTTTNYTVKITLV